MSRSSRKVSMLAQAYVGKPMPPTIEVAKAWVEAANRDEHVDPLDDIAAEASRIITAAGLPSEGNISFYCSELHKLVAGKGYGEGTQEWYAAKMLECIHMIRFCAPRFQGFELQWKLIRLGHLIRSAEIDTSYPGGLDHVVNLRRAVDGNRAVQKDGASKRHEGWRAAAREEFRRNRKLSPERCAERVIEKLGLSVKVGTVRKIIAPEKKLASL